MLIYLLSYLFFFSFIIIPPASFLPAARPPLHRPQVEGSRRAVTCMPAAGTPLVRVHRRRGVCTPSVPRPVAKSPGPSVLRLAAPRLASSASPRLPRLCPSRLAVGRGCHGGVRRRQDAGASRAFM